MMALCDGERLALLPSVEDHKAVFDGDRGPNTGGMGTYSPSQLVNASLTRDILARIFHPTIAAMRKLGRPSQGGLYGCLRRAPHRGWRLSWANTPTMYPAMSQAGITCSWGASTDGQPPPVVDLFHQPGNDAGSRRPYETRQGTRPGR